MKQTVNRALVLAALAFVALTGCSAMDAQNPSGVLRPVNAVADGSDPRLMLNGADIVAYFVQGRPMRGSAQFSSTYEDVTFRFASAEHKALFDAQPERYLPQFGGYCTNGIVYGIPWGGDMDTWRIIDDKLYIFGGQGSKDAFELDVAGNLKLAQHYWADEVAGTNSFWQRGKRLVFRVPHYKTGAALAAEVASARSQQ